MTFDPFKSPVPLGGYVWFALAPGAVHAQQRAVKRAPTRRDGAVREPSEQKQSFTIRRAFRTAPES